MVRWLTAAAVTSVAPIGGSPAFAQAPPPSDDADPAVRAGVTYEIPLRLFNEENYDAELYELDRRYQLAPSYGLLYDMGRIQRKQNNYAAAMRSYARYLREGADQVPAERRKEVEAALAVLEPRVANIRVTVNVDSADVYADDIPVCTATIKSSCIGKSPLHSPILVNGGRHKITATKKGYRPAVSLVSVVGSDVLDVKLDLVSYDHPEQVASAKNPWVVPSAIGWGITGAGLVTAAITGTDKNPSLPTAFLIGSGVVAGLTTYLTIRALRWERPSSNVTLAIGANRLALEGRF